MLNAGRGYLEIPPWMAMAPGGAIFLTVLGFNFWAMACAMRLILASNSDNRPR
jgi:ABC-type dipeptide/oligopeptide/nickel transport system permease subunit